MIDLQLLRDFPDQAIALLKKKDPSFDTSLLLSLDQNVRLLRQDVESLRSAKNDLANQAKSGITPELREQSILIGKQLKEKEMAFEQAEKEFKELYMSAPNYPMAELPEGGKEANRVVKEWSSKPEFNFPVKNHVELGESLGWLDFATAARLAGSNFALYKGDAVKLMYALTMFMLKNNMKHGFDPVLPSVIVNETSLEVSSNFPKFRDQVYTIPEDKYYLTPTAEVNIANMYREHIFMASDLPKRFTAWTSCFRREAGNYGALERGLIRIHQFEKVELYTFCEPDHAAAEQERMLACAEDILQQLGLHYRVSLLAAQDCSFPSRKTYDIEAWLPGQGQYYEVSSVSDCGDFQARRGQIRLRRAAGAKTELVYTLNGSSLALPRLMVALMETYQQADGSIIIPDILKKEGIF